MRNIVYLSLTSLLYIVAFGILFISKVSAAPKWKKIIANSGGVSLQGGFVEFSKDATWVVPAGVTKIHVLVIGGGGGGGNPNNYPAGGGGGGGSCIKRSGTELASANGGQGGKYDNSISPGAGAKTSVALTVTSAESLNIFVGGGGGGGGWAGGGGGYGPCGVGGAGGGTASFAGGAGGANLGGGGGAAYAVGNSAASSTGGNGSNGGYNGASGGSSSAGGAVGSQNSAGGGGGSGGAGGFGGANGGGGPGSLGTGKISCLSNSTTVIADLSPGEPGLVASPTVANSVGGGPGAVYIWW